MNAIPPIHPRRVSTAFVQMRSGACVDLLLPDLSPVKIEDIATALSRIPRFNGHTRGDQPYSVAQHSLHVVQAIEAWGYAAPVQLTALFHDAPEALIGDVVTPVKLLLGQAWADLEARLAEAVRRRFSIPLPLTYGPVRTADASLLATERRDLLLAPSWEWPGSLPPAVELRITAEPASVAYSRWLEAAHGIARRCGIDLEDRKGIAR